MIEVGRQTNIKLEDRICPKCESNKIEDELHFLLECPYYIELRTKLENIVKIKSPLINNLSSSDKMCWIMSNSDEDIIKELANYIYNATTLRHASPTAA